MNELNWSGGPVLVTGGAGFIGSHLVDALVSAGARVRVLDNLSTGLRSNFEHLKSEIELLEADLRDPQVCHRACAGIDTVFHQAALGSVPRSLRDPATSFAVNAGGTSNLFAAGHQAGVRRVVYASSSSVYGDSPNLPKREGDEGAVLSPYAASKKTCEDLADIFHRCYGFEIVGLRYFNVFGPRQRPDGPYAAVIPRFFDAYARGLPPTIYGDGEQSRDFTHVDDAVRANLLAGSNKADGGAREEAFGRAFNVAGGKQTTLNQLWRWIRQLVAAGRQIDAESLPEPSYDPPRAGDVRHSLADLSAAERALGYRPQVAIDDGLAAAVEHYLSIASAAG